MAVNASSIELPIKRVATRTSATGRKTRVARTLTIDQEPIPTPDELRRWRDVQVPYPNLAGRDDDVDWRASGFVRDLVRKFQTENRVTYEKWRIIRRLLDNMRAGPGEGEVPELYKALERMIPRIEEQVLAYQKWFQTHGREKSDLSQTELITAFISWQLEQDHFRDRVQPDIRTMLSYGFVCTKTWWETRSDRRFKRNIKKVKIEGVEQLQIDLEEVDQVVFNGPRGRLVDPFDFFIDTDTTTVRDAMFVGDMVRMTYEEIAGAGCFQNYEELKDNPQHERYDYTEWYKRERSPQRHSKDHKKVDGLPTSFYVTEFWCSYDLYGNGEMLECVITVANFQTVIRLQENFYDDKHRPYAIGRANREAFDFFAVAPLDNAIQSQMTINQHRALALRSHKLSLAPWIFTEDHQDLPDNIWDIKVGSIIPVANPQGIVPVSVKSTMGEARYSEQILREDIEESIGSTRMLGGSADSNTATEATMKLSESSRRIRSYVQSYCMMLNEMLTQFHAMNAQYVTTPQRFRVLGKPGKGLKAYEEVNPEMFQTELDFTFTALGSMHSGDLRATQLMAWLNLASPIIAQYPGQVDQIKILQLLFKDMVGGAIDPDDVLSLPTPPDQLMSQEEENIMIRQGQDVEVDRDDNHQAHIDELKLLWPTIHMYTGIVQMSFIDHMQKHLDFQQQEEELARRSEQDGPGLTAFQSPAEQLDPNRGTTGRQKQPGDESGIMAPPSALQYQPGQSAGETPGPPAMGTTPASDRMMGQPQTANQMTA